MVKFNKNITIDRYSSYNNTIIGLWSVQQENLVFSTVLFFNNNEWLYDANTFRYLYSLVNVAEQKSIR